MASEAGGVFRIQDRWAGITTGSGNHCFDYNVPRYLPEHTDILVRAENTASNNASAGAYFDIALWEE